MFHVDARELGDDFYDVQNVIPFDDTIVNGTAKHANYQAQKFYKLVVNRVLPQLKSNNPRSVFAFEALSCEQRANSNTDLHIDNFANSVGEVGRLFLTLAVGTGERSRQGTHILSNPLLSTKKIDYEEFDPEQIPYNFTIAAPRFATLFDPDLERHMAPFIPLTGPYAEQGFLYKVIFTYTRTGSTLKPPLV